MSGEGMPLATVLVADDSEDNRELLSQMLRVQGYRVVCAADGAEALDVLAGQPIDLALVDVMMPRCTGFAVCRTVKARPETRLIPVVLITGLGSGDDRIRGIESGADDFLNKPIRKEELLARVRSRVRLKRFTDELENAETASCNLSTVTPRSPPGEPTAKRSRRRRPCPSCARKLGAAGGTAAWWIRWRTCCKSCRTSSALAWPERRKAPFARSV